MRRSVLFVNPAYHYSFTMRDELRRGGWRADVLMPTGYPTQLLFADDVVSDAGTAGNRFIRLLRRAVIFAKMLWTYDYFVIYGEAEPFVVTRKLPKFVLRSGSPELWLMKKLGKRVLFFPHGCRQERLRRDFAKHEGGRLCANCILPASVCNDVDNQKTFDLVNRYHDFVIANTPMVSESLPQKKQIRFVSLDLQQFRPDLEIPEAFRLPKTGRLRILHSFVDKGRQLGEKNVKGSPYIAAAVRRLEREGAPVEYFYVNDVPARDMRYYQAQADIVVDQLIYGWWGSTAIECLGLGKPVVCYLSPSLKEEFYKTFPDSPLPIVEATTENIYDVLRRLVEDVAYREQKGREAREFAARHFDVKKNAPEFATLLRSLAKA